MSKNVSIHENLEPIKFCKKDIIIQFSIMICAVILGILLNNSVSSDDFPFCIFGLIFFLAGYYVGMTQPIFGIIFLFAHGGIGLYLVLLNFKDQIQECNLFSDTMFTNNEIISFISSIIVLGFICVVLYNLVKPFRNWKYSKFIGISFIALGTFAFMISPEYIYKLITFF